ncbi:hypothetical protein ABT023_10645 [Micromonospora sp. NPDC002296]|uniref:hypothetical protein n=1 Tax=Micromonospora sp. NPDC002296 TaxID=3154271 RepID=UPI00332F8D3D
MERLRVAVPRRYPVRVPGRDRETPENLLAEAAVDRVVGDIEVATTALRLTRKQFEYRVAMSQRDELLRLKRLITASQQTRTRARRRPPVSKLIDQTERRAEMGRLAQQEAYSDLVEWCRLHLAKIPDMGAAGKLSAQFYDSDFDTTLFEIWLLSRLSECLTAKLGAPFAQNQGSTVAGSSSVSRRWNASGTIVSLYFQAPLSALTGEGNRWMYQGAKMLGARPDLGLVCEGVEGKRMVMLIDAKLRQRASGLLTEEVYKMLGYFSNDGTQACKTGAIVYHSPAGHLIDGRRQRRTLISRDGGVVEVLGIEPGDIGGTQRAMETLVEHVLRFCRPVEAVRE